jgi:AraC family transcriptional regulator, regulatory protein of adaptative response / DNA-3-methyladenine glycosylase II
MTIDPERLWRAIELEDPRFDGWVFCGVTSTGIYCRPSCPARTPKRENVCFFPTAAAAQEAGFRACKRCRPDATPGSPEWDRRADLVGAAMRLIADGVVDREGVTGLARRLGYSERHVHRELVAVAGAGPLALARAARAQTARVLMETTSLSATEVAFAAGFQSVRQFNDTVKAVFAASPTQLRAAGGGQRGRAGGAARPQARGGRAAQSQAGATAPSGAIVLRLPFRAPLAAQELIAFLNVRAVPGVEQALGRAYRRSLRLPRGEGVVELEPQADHVRASFWLTDLRDLGPATQRSRALLDLDADPCSVLECLGADELIGALVAGTPGRRVPGHVDAHELAIRAVLGQQVSVAGARTHAARLVHAYGRPLRRPLGEITHAFPSAQALAAADPETLAMPAARKRALLGLAAALASGEVRLDAGADRADARDQLLALPGIGAWTAEYVALRALRDPDAFLAGDLGVRRGLEALGHDGRPAAAQRLAQRWRPYRAYAVMHLWAHHGAGPQTHAGARIQAPRQQQPTRIPALLP